MQDGPLLLLLPVKYSGGASLPLKIDYLRRIYSLKYILLLEKAMAPHSSILAWKIPWMEEPGGLLSMGSQSQT